MSVTLSLSTGMAMDAIVAALLAFTSASLNCRFARFSSCLIRCSRCWSCLTSIWLLSAAFRFAIWRFLFRLRFLAWRRLSLGAITIALLELSSVIGFGFNTIIWSSASLSEHSCDDFIGDRVKSGQAVDVSNRRSGVEIEISLVVCCGVVDPNGGESGPTSSQVVVKRLPVQFVVTKE